MRLHQLLSLLVLLTAAAGCTRLAPTSTSPSALPATDTGLPPIASASPSQQPGGTETQAAYPRPATSAATASAAATLAPATDTATGAAPTDTQSPVEATATLVPSPTPSAALPTGSPTPSATLPPSTIIGQHVVQPGETLFCIARGYGVLPAAIAQTNGLNQALFIYPGQQLQIPAVPWVNMVPGPVCAPQFTSPFTALPALTPTPAASPTLPQFQATVTPPPFTPLPPSPIIGQHVVLAGETVFCIGRGYGVLPGAIAQANGLGQELLIYPGQVLKIPSVQWVNIAPGPVCAPQFTSPYPGLPVLPTATTTLAASPTPAGPPLAVSLNWNCIANCSGVTDSYVLRVAVTATGGSQPYTYVPGQTYSVTVPHCTNAQGTAAVTSADGQTAQAAWVYHDTACP